MKSRRGNCRILPERWTLYRIIVGGQVFPLARRQGNGLKALEGTCGGPAGRVLCAGRLHDVCAAVFLGELIPYLSEKVRRETLSAQSPEIAGRFDPAISIGH